jgi:hypothetical protein
LSPVPGAVLDEDAAGIGLGGELELVDPLREQDVQMEPRGLALGRASGRCVASALRVASRRAR